MEHPVELGKKKHPNKSSEWIAKKYWTINQDVEWRFKEGEAKLYQHASTKIVRHIKVKGTASPYDGNLTYWSTRLGRNPELSNLVTKLLKRQKGKCQYCGQTFRDSDKWEVDHSKPLSLGGKDRWDNLQLLHKHCHDIKTANDGSSRIRDKDGITEEPDEVKSRSSGSEDSSGR